MKNKIDDEKANKKRKRAIANIINTLRKVITDIIKIHYLLNFDNFSF